MAQEEVLIFVQLKDPEKHWVELELQLQAYVTGAATLDPSHSFQHHQILNPLSKARDGTHILTEAVLGSQPTEPQ